MMPPTPGFALRIRSFHDLPLWAKVLVAPSACIVAVVAIAVSIWLGAHETESRLADVADIALPTAAASARMLDAIDTIQSSAMRAVVWQQANVPEATIDALIKDVGLRSNDLRKNTADMIVGRAA